MTNRSLMAVFAFAIGMIGVYLRNTPHANHARADVAYQTQPQFSPDNPACKAQSPGALPTASQAFERNTTLLCYSEYVVKFSGISRTPIWSAERLTRARVETARQQTRVDAFHPDPNLPTGAGSDLSDFKSSGYDRGHLTPNADAATPQAAYETFSLANIVPQDPENNRHLWADIESNVRYLANRSEVYVVTGPLFIGSPLKALNRRVLVPTHLFKAVYAPSAGVAGVYVSPNDASGTYDRMSIAQFTAQFGITPFPDIEPELTGDATIPAIKRYR